MKKSLSIQRNFRLHLRFGGQVSVVGLLLLLFISNFLFAQNPLVKQWDYRFGGSNDEQLNSIQQTSDGGYILGGTSWSNISGDKTQTVWGVWDYWILKTDSLGTKQWDKNFGGTFGDALTFLQQTADGGYILGGQSQSGIGGDKTENCLGGDDFWIIKIDSLGTKQWDKDLGGTSSDFFSSLQQTTDGGYILGGYSNSGIGANKTQDSWGGFDYWIIKTDSLGNQQWDKDFGGTGYDVLYSLQQTADGGYILGGASLSGIGGDKTQPSWGDYDYWMIKTDSLGVKEWDKDFGGLQDDNAFSIQQTLEGGYILGGYSSSGISGDKTQATWGSWDYWIVKTDSQGIKEWDKDFGGTAAEESFGNISKTLDEGYLITGTSYSPISGDKTEVNLGIEQTWVVKIDSSGNKQWDKTLLTNEHDENGLAIQTKDGCYLMVNTTLGGVAGDKTQPSWGGSDFWIIKFCDSTLVINPPAPMAFNAGDTDVCEKFCTNFFDQSINNPTTWQWQFPGGDPPSSTDQNPTNLCYNIPGVYDVTLITTNANGNDTLTLPNYITVYPTPPFPTITQVGYILTSSAATFYQWQLNSVDIPGATNQSFTILQTGYYTVIVGDSNNCKNSTTLYVLISGIDEVNDSNISIHPNPSNGNFIVELLQSENFGEVSIDVVNTLGQKVFSSEEKIITADFSKGVRTYKKEIDLSDVANGIYFIEIKTENEGACPDFFGVRKKIVIEI